MAPSSPQRTGTAVRYVLRVSDERVRRLLSMFLLDDVRGLAPRYENRCLKGAATVSVELATRRWRRTLVLEGYVPPGLSRWWRRLLRLSGLDQRHIQQLVGLLETTVSRGTRVEGSTLPNLGPDECVSEDVGLVHDPVEVLWRGRPAVLFAIAPRGWKLTLYYREEDAPYYRRVEMRPRGCLYVAEIPQDRLVGDRLYYYIEARDARGRPALGSGSKGSPNIVDVHSCLVTGSGE